MHKSVSVVIPVRNEANALARAITSVLDQTYPNITEIIVADGMSTDNTASTAVSFGDPRIAVVKNRAMTTPAGLNTAIRATTADVVVRCDAHSVLPTAYVATAVELIEATGAVNVGGIQLATGTTVVQSAIALAMSSRIGVGDAKFHYGGDPGPTDTVYLGAFDRKALVDAGLFDETLIRNQDYELNIRLRAQGGLVYFDPRLAVQYFPRPSLRKLAIQYFQYGAWKRVVHRRHPDSIRARQLAAPLLVIGLALSAGLAFTSWRIVSVVVPLAYLVALAASTISMFVRTRKLAALVMPAAVAVMHVAWGFGYLSGLRPGRPTTPA